MQRINFLNNAKKQKSKQTNKNYKQKYKTKKQKKKLGKINHMIKITPRHQRGEQGYFFFSSSL